MTSSSTIFIRGGQFRPSIDPIEIGTVRHRPQWVPASVALYITAAYWFTSSTSFANPAITIARSMSSSFAGIAPGDVPAFVFAQFAGAGIAAWVASRLFDEDLTRDVYAPS